MKDPASLQTHSPWLILRSEARRLVMKNLLPFSVLGIISVDETLAERCPTDLQQPAPHYVAANFSLVTVVPENGDVIQRTQIHSYTSPFLSFSTFLTKPYLTNMRLGE